MRVMITGLCLQGNKGGPALAFSLVAQLEKIFPELEVFMSVPSREFEYEKNWAARSGIDVVSDFSHLDLIAYLFYLPVKFKRDRVAGWIAALKTADLVVDLSGVSYVGPPQGTTKRVVLNGRFKYYLFSRLFGKPFLAWTQSYGPFSNGVVRLLARNDLARLPVIMCRGEQCSKEVGDLLPGKRVQVYPDVALTLPFNRDEGQRLVAEAGTRGPFVSLSPSSVLYSKSPDTGSVNAHVEDCVELCRIVAATGRAVLIVPHSYRSGDHDPLACDFAVGALVCEAARREGLKVAQLGGDRSAVELKSVISNADIHVGGRYHSLVAALSSGVPAVALSWHAKYADLLDQFGLGEQVIPLVHGAAFREQASRLLGQLLSDINIYRGRVAERQKVLEQGVEANREEFERSYRQVVA